MLRPGLSEPDAPAGMQRGEGPLAGAVVEDALDQLEALEALREAVSLRSYGSKNPLTEYKIDGFNMFDEMLDSIRSTVMSRVFKVRIQLSPEALEQRRLAAMRAQQNMNAQHSEAENITQAVQRQAGAQMNGDQARRSAASGAMQQRTQIGRAHV